MLFVFCATLYLPAFLRVFIEPTGVYCVFMYNKYADKSGVLKVRRCHLQSVDVEAGCQ